MSGHRLPFDLAKMPIIEVADDSTDNIYPDRWKIVQVNITSSKTMTLKNPEAAGIFMLFILVQDNSGAADLTLNSDSEINDTPFTSVSFDAEHEWVALMSVPDADGTFRWAIIGNDGVAFS